MHIGPDRSTCEATLAICLTMLLGFAIVCGLFGYVLYRPHVVPNLGVALYNPPPGTQLYPTSGVMDAPEPVDLEPEPSPAPHVAGPPPPRVKAKRVVVAHKRRPRSPPNAQSAYAQQPYWDWNQRWDMRLGRSSDNGHRASVWSRW